MASVVVFAGGILVEDQLTIQSDPEEWVNQDTQVIRDIDTLKREVDRLMGQRQGTPE